MGLPFPSIYLSRFPFVQIKLELSFFVFIQISVDCVGKSIWWIDGRAIVTFVLAI